MKNRSVLAIGALAVMLSASPTAQPPGAGGAAAYQAIRADDLASLKTLINTPEKANAPGMFGNTPLMDAARRRIDRGDDLPDRSRRRGQRAERLRHDAVDHVGSAARQGAAAARPGREPEPREQAGTHGAVRRSDERRLGTDRPDAHRQRRRRARQGRVSEYDADRRRLRQRHRDDPADRG